MTLAGQPGTFQGEAYFVGTSQTSGNGLWKSNGTVAGTVLVVPDLNDGGGFTSAGNRFYFFASREGTMSGLWSSDGTAAGTDFVSAVADNFGVDYVSVGNQINPEIAGNNGKCCFVLRDNTSTKRQVWASDGTASGTYLLIDNIGKNQALVAASDDGGFYIFVGGGPKEGRTRPTARPPAPGWLRKWPATPLSTTSWPSWGTRRSSPAAMKSTAHSLGERRHARRHADPDSDRGAREPAVL